MSVNKPSIAELRRIAASFGFDLSDAELEDIRRVADGTLVSYARLDQLAAPILPVKYLRDAGWAPTPEENPYNAWAWRCSVKGAKRGKLAGRTIALKDNISLAGIPLRNGSAVLAGFIPNEDATVVTRILDAGGEVIGKAVCENFSFSGGSHTSDGNPVLNPVNLAYTSGGSSSGSGALVASGAVDMALGGDQGGSIRIPSSWCGIVGLKPTHGLVPYTGIFPIEGTLDHVGPMTKTVADAALLLEVIAGEDGLDPRQVNVRTARYTAALSENLSGLRVAVVREGFGWEGVSEADVDEAVRAAVQTMGELGAQVTEVSIPLHRDGLHIWNAIAVEGATAQMVRGDGMGWNWRGHYSLGIRDFFGRARRARANDFPLTVKLVVLLGQYLSDRYNGHYYAKAQNLGRTLRAAYDAALSEADLLVMPTMPMKAMRRPEGNIDLLTYFHVSLDMLHNTCPFDITGHPAITVPCGQTDGLPIGLMLIGRHFDESAVLRAAHTYEQARG
jgi:amidase